MGRTTSVHQVSFEFDPPLEEVTGSIDKLQQAVEESRADRTKDEQLIDLAYNKQIRRLLEAIDPKNYPQYTAQAVETLERARQIREAS